MARNEADREDLLAEAAALVERVELNSRELDDHVVAGFRTNGAVSLYFGQDRAYQFNTRHELRRAFVNGVLYKAERGRLVSLRRQRTENEVSLLRNELGTTAASAFIAQMEHHLRALRQTIECGRYHEIGRVPAEANVVGRLADWLANVEARITVASSPRVA